MLATIQYFDAKGQAFKCIVWTWGKEDTISAPDAKHGTLEPCKHHLRIHNLCIDDPEENVQCWLCSLHSAHTLTMLLLKSFLQDPRESYTISPHKPLGENLQYWLHTVSTHVKDNQKDFEAPTARPPT